MALRLNFCLPEIFKYGKVRVLNGQPQWCLNT